MHAQMNLLKRADEEVRKDLQDFFGLRVKKLLSETVRYDVVDAVISSGFDDISAVVPKGEALMAAVMTGDAFKTTVESFNRVGNLVRQSIQCFRTSRTVHRRWRTSVT